MLFYGFKWRAELAIRLSPRVLKILELTQDDLFESTFQRDSRVSGKMYGRF